MRERINIGRGWSFRKGETLPPSRILPEWDVVNIPHTYNGIDGQDGGGDYYRGRAVYIKRIRKDGLPCGERYYLEVGAANSTASVYLNGRLIKTHSGGYSLFRAELTDELLEENLIAIVVDNSEDSRVYPTMADFTFYGGVYRDVNIVCVAREHFDLDYCGGSGVLITPKIFERCAKIEVETFVTNYREGARIRYEIMDGGGDVVCSLESADTRVNLFLENARLWRGRKDPYLYTLRLTLLKEGREVDRIEEKFGCRSIAFDAERGFMLNGEEYPLRGVSRHQDRPIIGNAITYEHHKEDAELIYEMGATAVRLAHYQHDSSFYDLCDELGLVVWAEIPYISHNIPEAAENAMMQMRELIVQCYNHPSIVIWGLSNEITLRGGEDESLIKTHRELDRLCHELDKTRYTAVAALSGCPMDAKYLRIADLVAYNHYFGWYGGDTSMNGAWFDEFHKKYPETPIGCSEYGCEALDWHTSAPEQGDYTEEYQAYYHEELIKQLFSRKYLFATFVWNMFDFAADARCEGGENGMNHKGLVTFDRRYRKDAFYAYKAWLSDEPFVHICSKRYADRCEERTAVTVYSNMDEVTLFVNGAKVDAKRAEDHFFRFEIKNEGLSRIVATAGEVSDSSVIRRVATFPERYKFKESIAVLNWFDITERDGCLSLKSKLSEVMKTSEGRELLMRLIPKEDGGEGAALNEEMLKMMGAFTLIRLVGMMSVMGASPSREELLSLNESLNRVPKCE